MFMVAYNKNTYEVVYWRCDTSTNPISAQQAFDQCQEDKTNWAFKEIPMPNLESLAIHRTVFNPDTNEFAPNPNWIEPPAVETDSIPVSDPGAA